MLNGTKPSATATNGADPGRRNGALARVETWLFDLDNTLYPASCNLFAQVDRRIGEFIAQTLKLDMDEAYRLQKTYFQRYGTTLHGLMKNHGLPPDGFLDYVHKIDVTALPPNPALDAALGQLPGRKIVFTNGSHKHAENVMARLGIGHRFEAIFDIVAADYVPKPDPFTYDVMVRRHWVDPRSAVMVEDIPKNLVPAHDMGMTTVLVRGQAEWSQDGADGDHIHHATDDLVAWLTEAANAIG